MSKPAKYFNIILANNCNGINIKTPIINQVSNQSTKIVDERVQAMNLGTLNNIAQRAETYKPKPRTTYKMINEYIDEKYSFKVHSAYIAEVKRSLGLTMYNAPNAVETLKNPRKHPTPIQVDAIKDALTYFEVI